MQSCKQPCFSVMMCVYNDTLLLNKAVGSLKKQNYENWELLILDNSDENEEAWKMIEDYADHDDRIRAFKSDHNVGWAKGSAILMQYVQGEYVTFLSADDWIADHAFETLNNIIETEDPDVIFVGNYSVHYNEESGVEILGGRLPEYKIYADENRVETIAEIMEKVCYNAMFHYSKVSFLRKNQIDFFEPYYGDCAAMTKAMEVADKIITLDQPIYYLTLNTSQTTGHYIWHHNVLVTAVQWDSVKQLCVRRNFTDNKIVRFICFRLMKNAVSLIEYLCTGKCRNLYMNNIEVSFSDILEELENNLVNQEMQEMFLIGGVTTFSLLLQQLVHLRHYIHREETARLIDDSWISDLIQLALYCRRRSFENIKGLRMTADFILREENRLCIGIDYFYLLVDRCNHDEQEAERERIQKVTQKYNMMLERLEGTWLSLILNTEK